MVYLGDDCLSVSIFFGGTKLEFVLLGGVIGYCLSFDGGVVSMIGCRC